MTKLLEIKEKLTKFYSYNETYVKPVIKFLGLLIMYLMISHNVGYNSKVSNIAAVLVLSLVGCLLPTGVSVFLAAVVILLDLYSLSAPVALIGAGLFLLLYVVYFRFSSHGGAMVLVTPVLMKMNIANIVPVGTGLLKKPYSIIPSLVGVVVYFFLNVVHLSASAITSDKVVEGEESSKYMTPLNQLVGNKEFYLVLALFLLTTVVVYFVRRSKMDHSWSIATVAGVVIQLVGFIVGYLVFDISDKYLSLILGNIVALLIGFAIQFVFMNLDYARTERVQFEDDDYYYYVKAVPKKSIASKSVKVKTFGTTSMAKKLNKTEKIDDLDLDEEDEQDKIARQVIAKELDINEDWLK